MPICQHLLSGAILNVKVGPGHPIQAIGKEGYVLPVQMLSRFWLSIMSHVALHTALGDEAVVTYTVFTYTGVILENVMDECGAG